MDEGLTPKEAEMGQIIYRAHVTTLQIPRFRHFKMYDAHCLADVMNGFWINEQDQLTKGSDADVWIPPHRIYFIKKVSV